MSIIQIETDEILIFKTNLKYKKDLLKIAPLLNNDTRIKNWSVDVEDIDKILRIVGNSLRIQDIVQCMQQAGFFCEELQD